MSEQSIHTVQIKKDFFIKLKSQGIPLIYFSKEREWNGDTNDYELVWKPELSSLKGTVCLNAFPKSQGSSALAFGKTYTPPINPNSPRQYIGPEYEVIQVEEFNPDNVTHVKALFHLHIYKRQNSSDRFACRELLWYLSNCFLNINVINEVVMQFDATAYRPYVYSELRNLARCLSIPKQKLLQGYLASNNIQLNIYCPTSLIEALKITEPEYDVNNDWDSSIFDLIRKIVIQKESKHNEPLYNVMHDDNISNFFIKIRRWIIDENYIFDDFQKLSQLIRLFSPDVQMTLLKRYFLAVYKRQTNFDLELIRSFRTNQLDNWDVYYHCLYEASKPVRIGLQLLSDNIITYIESGGQALQTINGTLDMAYALCDASNPAVDFELNKIVPRCNGGAVPNNSFLGFICDTVVYELKEDLFSSSDDVFNLGCKVLKTIGTQDRDYKCFKPLNYQDCKTTAMRTNCNGCEHLQTILHERWEINGTEETFKLISIFLKEPIEHNHPRKLTTHDIVRDPAEIKARIVGFLKETMSEISAHRGFKAGYVRKHNESCNYIQFVLNEILRPIWMMIQARDNAHIGMCILASEIGVSLDSYDKDGVANSDAKVKETQLIKPHILKGLEEIIGKTPDEEGVFYMPYDLNLLRRLRSTFYSFNGAPNSNSTTQSNTNFLTHTRAYGFCAPEYQGDKNSVVNLPYFCCRGSECFRNALSHQTLTTCESWHDYNILHILEILGHPQIKQTDAGYEPTELIRGFIGLVNKASLLFRRVICRECGHILFPKRIANFNRYNRFKCFNPICIGHNKEIYLSRCHQCKSGLIDSRDSKRCPNGWLICPTCLACCTDGQIEIQAQKYEMRRNPVPHYIQRTRGLGHNNKNQYFCPKCGGIVTLYYDLERQERQIKCSVCHTEFKDA